MSWIGIKAGSMYTIHMKRTNLVLDEKILDEARRLAGARTYSEVVNIALRELVHRVTFARIDGFANSGIWDGDLGAMRDDALVSR
jgi:Arc/MetJ family transcription regulator